LDAPFYWCSKTILEHLIWQIKNENVQVFSDILFHDYTQQHIIFDVLLGNFNNLGKSHSTYRGSSGTDINPVTTFICVGSDFIYYVVGKLNKITGIEEMHIFYNAGSTFDIMKCKYICGGEFNRKIIIKLWKACVKKCID